MPLATEPSYSAQRKATERDSDFCVENWMTQEKWNFLGFNFSAEMLVLPMRVLCGHMSKGLHRLPPHVLRKHYNMPDHLSFRNQGTEAMCKVFYRKGKLSQTFSFQHQEPPRPVLGCHSHRNSFWKGSQRMLKRRTNETHTRSAPGLAWESS